MKSNNPRQSCRDLKIENLKPTTDPPLISRYFNHCAASSRRPIKHSHTKYQRNRLSYGRVIRFKYWKFWAAPHVGFHASWISITVRPPQPHIKFQRSKNTRLSYCDLKTEIRGPAWTGPEVDFNSSATSVYDHITDALATLHWLRLPERVDFKVAVIAFRVLHDLAPPYLSQLVRVADVLLWSSLTQLLHGSDCGYNPGWCRSHPTVAEMT